MFEPRRSLLVPTLTALAPLLFLLYRGATTRAEGTWTLSPGTALALAAVAAPACYAVVAAAVTVLDPATDGVLTRAVFAPSDGSLVVLAAAALGLAAYLLATTVGDLPRAVEAVASAAGVVVALPLAALLLAVTAVGNAAGTTPPFAVQAAVVGVGVALSVVWLALLANAGVSYLGPLVPVR
jgi:hypothetical protein